MGKLSPLYKTGIALIVLGLGVALVFNMDDAGKVIIGIGVAMAIYVAIFK